MRLLTCLVFAAGALHLGADPLSKSLEIDFFREVPNRSSKGLAVRSDGRVLPGPTHRELSGKIPADLLWTMIPTADAKSWLVGTGPEGKVFRLHTAAPTDFTADLAADLEATHVFALCALDKDTFLAGTSPQGTLSLVRAGKTVASATLPADSVFDIVRADGKSPAALVATGNPGRIYRIELAQFEQAGVITGSPSAGELAKAGITQFGEIRDRNVRRLLVLPDGRVIAGSAPKGNVYAFPASGGPPLLLLENREAEVTDLIADDAGAFYAAVTLSGTSGEARVTRPAPAPTVATPAVTGEAVDQDTAKAERFAGRGQLVLFPAGGLPETIVSRANTAFYRLAWHAGTTGRWLLISGGEQGELLAYVPAERRSLNLGATVSAQVNVLLPSRPGGHGLFLLLRNNPAGLSQLDFADGGARSLETRKLDLGVAAELGQVRFAQLSGPAENLGVALRTSFGSDELEGWSEWVQLTPTDGGWFAPGLRGRYVQLRLTHARSSPTPLAVDKATLFYLPQNRRPQLTDFRIFPVNLALIPAGDQAPPNPTATLGQMLFPSQREGKDDAAKRKGGLLNSPIVPAPGSQIVYWTLSDADDDNLASTFSISPEGRDEWTDLAVAIPDAFVQFDVSHLPEGRYRTRLAVHELAPRPESQRLGYTFETDVLTVDRTPPEILGSGVEHAGGTWRVRLEGRDALSLLEGAEFVLNNGARVALEHPADGILDSRHEQFVAEFTDAKAAGATSVEVILHDKSGNSTARRLPLR